MQNRFSKFVNKKTLAFALNNQDIKASDVPDIMECVIQHKVKHLDLGLNNIGDIGAITIANKLPFSSVRVLLLPSCKIQDEGAEALANILKSCTSVVSFDFSYNDINHRSKALLQYAANQNPNIIDAQCQCSNLISIHQRYFRYLLREKLIEAWEQIDKRKDFTIHDILFVQKRLPLMKYTHDYNYNHTETFKKALSTIDSDINKLLLNKLYEWPNFIFPNIPNDLSTKILYTVFIVAPEKLKCVLLSPYKKLDYHLPQYTKEMGILEEKSKDQDMGYYRC